MYYNRGATDECAAIKETALASDKLWVGSARGISSYRIWWVFSGSKRDTIAIRIHVIKSAAQGWK